MGRLDGKVALISGTGGGQGRAAAQIFTREGARVVGCDIKVEGNEETAELIRAEGGQFIGLAPLDLTDPAEAKRFVDTAIKEFGGIDILYNNASAQRFAPFGEMTDEDWDFTMKNDLQIIYPVTRYAWAHLVERGGGSIINTASGAGLMGSAGFPTTAHSTAKAGVMGFTRSLAGEGAALGIRVNAIAPGGIETPVIREHMTEEQRAEIVAAAARIALEDGLERVTLRAVAGALGVRPGLITHYFPVAEELVVEAFAHNITDERHRLVPLNGTPLERIAGLVRRVLNPEAVQLARLWLNARHLARFIPALAQSLEVQEALDREQLTGLVVEGVEAGVFHPDDAFAACVRILVAIDGYGAYANNPDTFADESFTRFVPDAVAWALRLEPGVLAEAIAGENEDHGRRLAAPIR